MLTWLIFIARNLAISFVMKNIILDLCGGSGSWSDTYKAAGFKVYNITLPAFDITKYAMSNDCVIFQSQDLGGADLSIPFCDIYGILAAPPCQEFSLAKGSQKRDFVKGINIVNSCLAIIQGVRLKHKLEFWAMENPCGFLRQFIGKPYFSFRFWEYGDDIIKRTDLWGYFNIPAKTTTVRPANVIKSIKFVFNVANYAEQTKFRQRTRPGFAAAFFKANSKGRKSKIYNLKSEIA